MRLIPTLSHHVPAFDGIRALAVIAVILTHASYGQFDGGFLGVDLFFALSGYLITGLLIKEYADSNSIRLDLFYLRRICRLIPALLVALVLALLIGRLLFRTEAACQIGWLSAFAILFGLANFFRNGLGLLAPAWSLAVEEQFYWLWPVTLRFLLAVHRGKFLMPAILSLIFLASALRACLKWNGADPQFLYVFTLTRMDSLFMGALAVVISGNGELRRAAGLLARFRLPEAILIGWALLLHPVNSSSAFLSYGGSTLIAFFSAVLLLCVAFQERKTFLLRLLESQFARWLGKRSYGVYLYHAPVSEALELFRVRHSIFNLILITALRFVIPIILAALSYRYIEMPFLRKKSRLRWQQKSAVKPA